MEIRRVRPNDDFDAIGEIYAQSWKAAYAGIVPQVFLDALTGAHWAGNLEKMQYDAYVLLDGGVYVGTSSVCAARDEGMAGWGEIISIYLLPSYFDRGCGGPLFEHAVQALADKGYADIYLWVLEDNVRARRFYEKHGFAPNGDAATITIADKPLCELRYVRRLY